MARFCIDAGHGGHDAGATGKYKEKDLNLKVALRLGEILKENGKTPLEIRQFNIPPQKFNDYFSYDILNQADTNITKQAYMFLKEHINEFKDAIDV